MQGLKYVAPVWDLSGYASASRNYIQALYNKGVPMMVEPHCFEKHLEPVCSPAQKTMLDTLINTHIPYDTVLCQLTPDMAFGHREEGKRNIVYFPWETSVVHPKWVACLNAMDEVWTSCQWCVDSIKSSGVTKPVHKVPHGIDLPRFSSQKTDYRAMLGISPSTYCFYNMCQWNPRKNPDGLLRAYFNAFSSSDDVVLVLKTYVHSGGTQEQKFIAGKIADIKADTGFKSFPRVLLITSMLNEEDVDSLHMSMDCFISLHFSEGFGLGMFEAGLAGKPVIATGATGNMEFMTKENSFPVDFRWGFVKDMSTFNGWYLSNGLWAEPSEVHAAQLMRLVFGNTEEAKRRGTLLKENISASFSWDDVAGRMLQLLG